MFALARIFYVPLPTLAGLVWFIPLPDFIVIMTRQTTN
jgi:hypothetical protein